MFSDQDIWNFARALRHPDGFSARTFPTLVQSFCAIALAHGDFRRSNHA
jgi:hypothetical protein